ncbi:MAG: IS3 family transposase, partial [Planctomycetaceae bacterium]|nr:IS3 family transposase [Planctomycetaceae bacterium]
KAKVALEAAKQGKTLAELSQQFQVHPVQISQWKRQLLEGIEVIFQNGSQRQQRDEEALKAELYQQIGQLKMELEWVKKKAESGSLEARRSLIEEDHPHLSIRHQCELLDMSRASYYYEPAGETPENLRLMRLIDEQYLKTPFYGNRRMAAWLVQQGEEVNRKRVQRLMRLMGLEAIYPGPRTTRSDAEHKVYPYLLRDVPITRRDQVWSTDITYIPMRTGYMYLSAVMDWHSRYVLSWRLSNSLDGGFCLEALEEALREGKPEIFNTDQGVQYTARAFSGRLEEAGVAVSMDGRGRALDNVFVERLWRAVKYEEVYLKDYAGAVELMLGLTGYFGFYNDERPHQSLGYRTPAEVYFGMPTRAR